MVPVKENWYLQQAFEKLKAAVAEQNRPGSVDGLLARFILGKDVWAQMHWQVDCTPEWMANSFQLTNFDCVSALGYSMWERFLPDCSSELKEGLVRVIGRDPFVGGHLSIARSPSRLLGIVLGALSLGSDGIEARNWCDELLRNLDVRFRGEKLDPLYAYIRFRIQNIKIDLDLNPSDEIYDLCFFDWVFRNGLHRFEPSVEQLKVIRECILFSAVTALRFESAHQAAFIWSALNANLFHALGELRLQGRHVAAILENFEPAMRRWRWDSNELKQPIKWPITQEREIQDIVWLILRSYFPDLVDEETLPKLGHSSYRADFGIPSIKVLIEVKYAYSGSDFKKIEKDLLQDSIPYLRDVRYESIIVFIYDASASVQEHAITKDALLQIPGISEAIIVSRPSQIAGPS